MGLRKPPTSRSRIVVSAAMPWAEEGGRGGGSSGREKKPPSVWEGKGPLSLSDRNTKSIAPSPFCPFSKGAISLSLSLSVEGEVSWATKKGVKEGGRGRKSLWRHGGRKSPSSALPAMEQISEE